MCSIERCTASDLYLPVELLSKPDYTRVFVDGKIPHGVLAWNAVDQRLPLRINCFQLSNWWTCQKKRDRVSPDAPLGHNPKCTAHCESMFLLKRRKKKKNLLYTVVSLTTDTKHRHTDWSWTAYLDCCGGKKNKKLKTLTAASAHQVITTRG